MWCGCFHCLRVYDATEVIDWVDDGETPLCPHCGVDAVMLGVTDLMELLAMHRTRFGPRSTKGSRLEAGLGPGLGSGTRLDPMPGSASDPLDDN